MKTNGILPAEVVRQIATYYEDPIKAGLDGKEVDIGLVSLARDEALVLAKLVSEYSPERSLEIGLGAASSSIAIAAARKCKQLTVRHITLDPYQESRSNSIGLVEISKAGLDDWIQWIP